MSALAQDVHRALTTLSRRGIGDGQPVLDPNYRERRFGPRRNPNKTRMHDRVSASGFFASAKTGRETHAESRLEDDALTLVEAAPDVVDFEEQPPRIDLKGVEIEGHSFEHFQPDILVRLTDGSTHAISVKYLKDAVKPDVAARHLAAAQALPPTYADSLILWMEDFIREQPRLDNARLVTAIDPVDEAVIERVAKHVTSMVEPMTLEGIARSLDLGMQGVRAAFVLFGRGRLTLSSLTPRLEPEAWVEPTNN